MVVLSTGAMAAPITAFLRIDPPKAITLSSGIRASRATLEFIQPPVALTGVTGLGTAVVILWRRRTQIRMKRRRRRRVRYQLRKISPIL